MSWKDIIKTKTDSHLIVEGEEFTLDTDKIRNYAKKLLEEKFPISGKYDKEYEQLLVGYEEGDSFKLGEITFKITDVEKDINDERILPVYAIEGYMLFNNHNIGSWSIIIDDPSYFNRSAPTRREVWVEIEDSRDDYILDSRLDRESIKELESKI